MFGWARQCACLALVVATSGTSCTSEEDALLLIDVRSDLVPVREFRVVRLRYADQTVPTPVTADQDYLAGARVAELRVPEGPIVVEVALRDGDRNVVGRPVNVDVVGPSTGITVVLTRNCRGVQCPGPGGDPAADACHDGMCVPGDCYEENSATCGPSCVAAADCPVAAAACATAGCIEGTCLLSTDDALCAAGQRCHTDLGCAGRTSGTPPVVDWVRTVESDTADQAHGVAVDAAGNVYVAGGSNLNNAGTDFGGMLLASDAGLDAWVASWDSANGLRWANAMSGLGAQDAWDVAFDPTTGSVVVVGDAEEIVDFGGGPTPPAGGADDGFIASFASADGAFGWSARFGGPGTEQVRSVAVDATGSAYVAAGLTGTTDIGTGPVTGGVDNRDVMMASWAFDGTPRWARALGNASDDEARAVVSTATGIHFSGGFSNDLDFGGGVVGNSNSRNVFFTTVDASGGHVSSLSFGDMDTVTGQALAVDSNGNIAVGGLFTQELTLAGTVHNARPIRDAFLLQADSTGAHRWGFPLGDSPNDGVHALAVDSGDNVYAAGALTGFPSLGGTLLYTEDGGCDAFVASWDVAGAFRWALVFGGVTGDDAAFDLIVDEPNSAIYVVGVFRGDADFGGMTVTGDASSAAFVMRLVPPPVPG